MFDLSQIEIYWWKMSTRLILIIFLLGCFSIPAFAQNRNRIDLDDMMIKGELHNDDRLLIITRQANELKNYVKFRKSFKDEMLQELPVPNPVRRF